MKTRRFRIGFLSACSRPAALLLAAAAIGPLIGFGSGCISGSLDLVSRLPRGSGCVNVVVVDAEERPVQGAAARIDLGGAFLEEHREATTDADGRAAFPNLGPGRYRITLTATPGPAWVTPPAQHVELGKDATADARFALAPAATVTGRYGEEKGDPSLAVPLPDRLLGAPLLDQRSWVLEHSPIWFRNAIPAIQDPSSALRGDFSIPIPASGESYSIVVVGDLLFGWGYSLETGAVEPFGYTEPIVLVRLGTLEPGETRNLGTLEFPSRSSWSKAPELLKGRFVDPAGEPVLDDIVMTVLPLDEGIGAFVWADADGRYHVRGLPPGRYRACAVWGVPEDPKQHAFDLEIPASPEVRNLMLMP